MKRFCVKCGKQTESLIGGLCKECYTGANRLFELPKKISIQKDRRNGKIRHGRLWLANTDENIAKILKEHIMKMARPARLLPQNLSIVLSSEGHEDLMKAEISFDVKIDDLTIPFKENVKLDFDQVLSDASMKLVSYYHEAIIQIRFEDVPLIERQREGVQEVLVALQTVRERGDDLAEAIDTKKVRGGYDLYIGSKKAAKMVARRFTKSKKAEVTYSNKLIGLDKQGKENYRHTFCIRFFGKKP
ncbi:MAG: 60S ribosomal export protein NMD3 [archaeon]|nr:60S ribosomal export protein NMD3 [archaeon]